MHRQAQASTGMQRQAQACTGMHRHAQACTGMHGQAQACTDMHRQAQTCTDMHRHAQTCTDMHMQALAKALKHALSSNYLVATGLHLSSTTEIHVNTQTHYTDTYKYSNPLPTHPPIHIHNCTQCHWQTCLGVQVQEVSQTVLHSLLHKATSRRQQAQGNGLSSVLCVCLCVCVCV